MVNFEEVEQKLVSLGYPEECVRYVCEEHNRHCTRLDIEHEEHACFFCDYEGRHENGFA